MSFRWYAVTAACALAVVMCAGRPLSAAEPLLPATTRITKTYWPKLFLTYSPDGSHLVYARHYNHRRGARKVLTGLRIVRADGSGDRPLLPEYEHIVQL